jgi:hypothetical protein
MKTLIYNFFDDLIVIQTITFQTKCLKIIFSPALNILTKY